MSEPAHEQNCHYDRHIIGVSHYKHEWWLAMQFIFSDLSRTQADVQGCDQTKFVDEFIPDGAPISKVQLIYDSQNSIIVGLRFTDREGMSFLDVGNVDAYKTIPKQFAMKWLPLGMNERLVGVKSGQRGEGLGFHCDLQFMIMRK